MKILPRVLSAAAAAGAACAAAGVVVVAVAFAIYAFAKTYAGPAGGSAVTAAVFAVVLGIGVLVVASGARGKKKPRHVEPEPANLMGRLMETARERPFVAAAGAVAAGLLALRNPTLVATVLGMVNAPPRPRRP